MPETDFELAEQVAAAATFFDDYVPKHIGHDHVEGVRHINFLHDLAELLAGDRAKEIYPVDILFGPKPGLSENDKLQAELKRDKAIEAVEEARRERNERNRTNTEDFERESGARP